MNEIIQSLETNATNGKENFCYISEDKLKALKELSEREYQENQQLKAKIKTYEDPEDLTLMFMYCNEKAKGEIEELEKENLILREIVMIKKMAIPYKEINDKSLYDLYTIPSYSDLSKENQELKKQLKIKHNGFMASVDESCDLAKENQKYKEVIDKAIEWIKKRINSCTIEAESTTNDTMCKITISGLYNLLNILEEVE